MAKRIKKLTALLFAGAFFFVFGAVLPIFSHTKPKTAFAENVWRTISSYTTYYDEKDVGRCENIRIAASLIDGVTIQAYGEFSFNKTVGRRTEEAGFKQAKIILAGEYVQGVGGGVCQVSTTLYNAALKSGLTVTEFHPHSLCVGYISPSRDAMVSDHSDFCFFNPYAFPVRLSAVTFTGGIKIAFLGTGNGRRYELCSRVLAEILPPEPIVKYGEPGEEERFLRVPKNGVKSELYVEEYLGDALISRKRVRTDEYRPIQGIIIEKKR